MAVYPKQSLFLEKIEIQHRRDHYLIDIPIAALPKIVPALREKEIPSIQVVDDEIRYLKATTREKYRQALTIPMDLLRKLEFDPMKPVYVAPVGFYGWIPAHRHGMKKGKTVYYTRVWLPIGIADALGIEKGKMYPAQLMGWSYPERETVVEVPEVKVEFLKAQFNTSYVENHYQWVIPDKVVYYPGFDRKPMTIRVYEILDTVFKRKIPTGIAACEIYYKGRGILQVDIVIPQDIEKEIAMEIGEAYRNISNQNFILSDTNEYPFLAECRSQWLSAIPRIYFQTALPEDQEWREQLIFGLQNTVQNLVDWHEFLFNAWKGLQDTYPMGEEFIKKDLAGKRREPPLVMTKNLVQLDLYLEKLKLDPCNVSAEKLHKAGLEKAIAGDEINELLRRIDFKDIPSEGFGYCWKYIRIISRRGGRQKVTSGTPARDYVYPNDEIEAHMDVPRGRQEESRITNGKKYQGFVWRKW